MTDLSAPLIVEVLTNERDGLGLVKLHLSYEATVDPVGQITVAEGYTTDFASIPRIVRPIICTMGKSARAALLHDWMLQLGDKRATQVFSEALRASNVSKITRWLMVVTVWAWTFPRFYL